MKVSIENNFVRLIPETEREQSFIHSQSLLITPATMPRIRRWLFPAAEAVALLERIADENLEIKIIDPAYLDVAGAVLFSVDGYEILVRYERNKFAEFSFILAPDGRFGEYFLWQAEDPLDESHDNSLDFVLYRRAPLPWAKLLAVLAAAR